MLDELCLELKNQTLQPPGNDQRIAAFCQAVLLALKIPERYGALIEVLQKMAAGSPSYRINHILRAFQHQLLRDEQAYPRAFTTADVWLESMRQIIQSRSKLARLQDDSLHKQVQSNVVERYKAMKLVMGLLCPSSDSLHVLDVGCSRNHGLKKVRLNLPFAPMVCGVDAFGTMPMQLLDRLLNDALQAPLLLGPSTGMDMMPFSLGRDAEWAKSCSFYPSELLNEKTVAEYDYLDKISLHGVDFIEGDIRDAEMLEEHVSAFDVVILSTFMYQLQSGERTRARQNALRFLAKDGVVIYQDYGHADSSDTLLEFEHSWFSQLFPYRTIVEFPYAEPDRLYELFRWSDGRCSTWIPGKDLTEALAYAGR